MAATQAALSIAESFTAGLGGSLSDFLLRDALPYVFRTIGALLILWIGFSIVGRLSRRLSASVPSAAWKSVLPLSVQIAGKILVALAAVELLGIGAAAIAAAILFCALMVGIAAQGGLSNLAGGIVIALAHPFQEGDYIESGAVSGVVQEIGSYYTTVISPENERIYVPNSTLSGSTIRNLSTEATRRMDFALRVSYDTDLDRVRKVLLATAAADDMILQDPAPEVLVCGHEENALALKLRVWVHAENYWSVYYATYEDIKKAFDQFGIVIPAAHTDSHTK